MAPLPIGPQATTNRCDDAAWQWFAADATAKKLRPTGLLVEDHYLVRRSMGQVLASEALPVAAARYVKDAFNLIFRNTPDLVVTYLCMAPLTVWDLFAYLKNRCPSLPMFVISARPLPFHGGDTSNAAAYFKKPLDGAGLLAAFWRRLGKVNSGQCSTPARS
jgi:DNA-binding NtrC family response regulator